MPAPAHFSKRSQTKLKWNFKWFQSESAPSKKFYRMGSCPEKHPNISIGNNVPVVFVDNQGAAWPGVGFILILGTFNSQQIGKKKSSRLSLYIHMGTNLPIADFKKFWHFHSPLFFLASSTWRIASVSSGAYNTDSCVTNHTEKPNIWQICTCVYFFPSLPFLPRLILSHLDPFFLLTPLEGNAQAGLREESNCTVNRA